MSDALRRSVRELGAVVAIGVASSVVLGVVLAVAQGGRLLTWIAYMLYAAGAVAIAFAFVAGTPPSPRKLAKQRAQTRAEGADVLPETAEKPFVSELVVIVAAGVVLFGLALLLELVT